MAKLELTGQAHRAQAVEVQFNFLKESLEQRRSFFERMEENEEKKKAWMESEDDPVLFLAKNMYEYLKAYFKGE